MADATGGWPSEARQPRSGKSTAAFRTISEVSGELAVPQHVLRFWETKFAQVRPMKRAGGRRYYRPEDVALLRTIRELLYRDGFTIRGAQKFLREGGAKGMAAAAAAPDGQARAERAESEAAALLWLAPSRSRYRQPQCPHLAPVLQRPPSAPPSRPCSRSSRRSGSSCASGSASAAGPAETVARPGEQPLECAPAARHAAACHGRAVAQPGSAPDWGSLVQIQSARPSASNN